MPSNVDTAIIKALGLDPACTTVASHGGSGFSSTAKISTERDGEGQNYFLKTSSDQGARVMFEG